VNIDQNDYMTAVGTTAGIRVVVLPQNQMALPEDHGITVSPGQYTAISINQVYNYTHNHTVFCASVGLLIRLVLYGPVTNNYYYCFLLSTIQALFY